MPNNENGGCNHCSISRQNILKVLNDKEIERISSCKTSSFFHKGEVLFQEGSMLSGVYCIREGICKLTKSANGKNQIVRFMGKGDVLGQREIMSEEEVKLTATALTDMQICLIEKEDFLGCSTSNTNFSAEIIRYACIELNKADNTIVNLAQKTAKQRLVDAIFLLEKTFGVDKQGYIQIQLSREEISGMIGVASESLTRLISELSNRKWIATRIKRIKILDREQLLKILNDE